MTKENFDIIWSSLLQSSKSKGADRLMKILLSNSTEKEKICRKLGVISRVDIDRVVTEYLQEKPRKSSHY